MLKRRQTQEAARKFAALVLAFLMVFQYTAAGLSVYAWAEDGGEAVQEEKVEKAEEKANEEAAKEAPEPEIVDPEPAPAAVNEGFWALINLICAIVSVLLSLFILLRYLGKGKKNVDDDKDDAKAQDTDAEEQKQQKIKKKGLLRIMDIIPAVVSVITFILTEDMSQPMQLVDQWTLLMVVILLVDVVLALFTKRTTKDIEDDDKEQNQQA